MSNTSLGNLTVNLVAETGSYEEGMDRAQRATEKLEKAAAKQAAELDKLRYAIDPLAGQLAKVEKQQQALNKAFADNKLNADEYGALNSKLEQTRRGLQGLGKEMKAGGMSASQLAFATRQIPAQFTDIFVSLASGQSPMTVFIQQGGQLKDMFGGIGPAAKAMGQYIAGLVNPYTVAAGAIGAVALAYYQGSEEADKFREALLLTGNAAGSTVDDLRYLADTFDSSVATTGKAAEAFAILASGGSIAAKEFDMIATAAIKMETATGKAVAETIKEFEQLAKSPVEASEELNKKYNYLTASIYEQIQALAASGDKTGAVTLAMNAYSDAVEQRSDLIVQNLGAIEGAWEGIKKAAKGAWDSVLDIGREDSTAEQLEQARKVLEQLKQSPKFTSNMQFGRVDPEAIKAQEMIITKLEIELRSQQAIAKYQADKAAVQKASIEAQNAINKLSESSLTNEEKKVKAVKEYLANIDKIRAADPNSKFLDQSKIDKDIAAIRAQFEENPKDKKQAEYRESAAIRMLDNLRQQQASLQLQLGTTEKIGSASSKLAAFEQEIADIKNKKILTAEQKSILANEEVLRAQYRKNAEIEKQIALQDSVAKGLEDEAKIRNQLASLFSQLQTDEEKRFELFKERLKLIEDAKKLTGTVDLEMTQRVAGDLFEEIPASARLDVSVSGPAGELDRILEEETRLNDWYERQTDMLNEAREAQLDANINWNAQELALKEQHEQALAQIEKQKRSAQIAIMGDFFGHLASMQNSESKKARAIAKAAALSQTIINTYQAATGAYAAMAPIPVVGPALGAAAAAAALAAGMANVNAIKGMAHSGIDNIPSEGTWLLDKGERVLSPRQNQDLTNFLANANFASNSNVKVEVINGSGEAVNVRKERVGTGISAQDVIKIFIGDMAERGPMHKALTQYTTASNRL